MTKSSSGRPDGADDRADSTLPYGRQWIDDEDCQAVLEVLRGDRLTTGPMVERFEAALCAATGAGRAVAVSSGTAALHTAYAAAGLGRDGPGDEIVTSPLTFAATANAALYLGATVRFADVELDTGNLDPAAAAAAATSRTRLLVAVDYTGHPADYAALQQIADSRGLSLVADSAHSLGARYQGRPVGSLATATALSFHPVKPITTAEGGAVLTDHEALADYAARFRSHGIERDPEAIEGYEGPWHQAMEELGYNYRLPDLLCALGVSQLRRLESFLARRREIAGRYQRALGDVDGLILPTTRPDVEPSWHLYVVQVVEPGRRRAFFERLVELGLGVQVHYRPVYLHPYYERLGYRRGLCPRAELRTARSVSLPIFPRMSDEDVDRAIEGVRQAAGERL